MRPSDNDRAIDPLALITEHMLFAYRQFYSQSSKNCSLLNIVASATSAIRLAAGKHNPLL